MKKLTFSLVVIALMLFSSSCGVNYAYVSNQNQNSTQVHLSSNNYQVVDKVSGSADVSYVLIFGGMNKKRLYENAYAKMVNESDLSGSKALINIMTEEQIGGVPPFYYKRTITVSASVIEFTR
jgi:hypothetical protein